MDITEKLPGHLSPRTSALFSMLPVCLFSSRRSEQNKYLSFGFNFQRRLCSRYCISFEHHLLDLKFLIVSVRVRGGAFVLSPPAERAAPAAGDGCRYRARQASPRHLSITMRPVTSVVAALPTWDAGHERPLKENSCLCHSQQSQPQLK